MRESVRVQDYPVIKAFLVVTICVLAANFLRILFTEKLTTGQQLMYKGEEYVAFETNGH